MEKLKEKVEILEKEFSENLFLEFKDEFIDALNKGLVRAAEKTTEGKWIVHPWVKKGILLLFKYGKIRDYSVAGASFFDKDTIPPKSISIEDKIRIVPGGTSIRSGCFIAPGVIIMPPCYVNIGAYVDAETLLDSHSLVGSCAQIGKRVHLSASAQIGGVLEPVGARPVIIEDDVFIGGNCGIYEGVLVRHHAVIASGVILTSSTKVFDIVNQNIIQSTEDSPLEIPPRAVVVSGSRQLKGEFAEKHGLSVYTPIIVKYRDEKTDAKSTLENILR